MGTTRMLSAGQAATARNTCPFCGAEVLPKQTPKGHWFITTYCSRTCSGKAKGAPRPARPCAFCGTKFVPRSGEHRRRYCTKRCSEQGMRNPRGWIRKRHGYPVFWTGKAEVLVHRIVMEEKLGRPLRETETVHHVNGDRGDWRAENLELWDHAQPHGQRVEDKIDWCLRFLADHGYPMAEPIAHFLRQHGYTVTPPSSGAS